MRTLTDLVTTCSTEKHADVPQDVTIYTNYTNEPTINPKNGVQPMECKEPLTICRKSTQKEKATDVENLKGISTIEIWMWTN